MNKIIKNKKFYLAIAFVFAVVAMCAFVPRASAQVLDNFEYWDSPKNHGWAAVEPAYPGGFPIWGMNVGEGMLSTVIDFQEGSRVLEVFYPSNVYVPGMQKYAIRRTVGSPNPIFMIKMRAPVSIEAWDSYDITVPVTIALDDNADGNFDDDADGQPDAVAQLAINMVPRANVGNDPVANPEDSATFNADTGIITVNVGVESEDGSWHLIVVNLAETVYNITGGTGLFLTADQIMLAGNQYRADDIEFAAVSILLAGDFHLFKINHVFTQLYGGYQRVIFTSYSDIDDLVLPIAGDGGAPNVPNTAILAMIDGCTDLCAVNFAHWQATANIPGVDAANVSQADYIAALPADFADIRRNAILGSGATVDIPDGAGGTATVDARLVNPCDVPVLLVDPGVGRTIFSASVGGAHDHGACTSMAYNAPLDTPIGFYPLRDDHYGHLHHHISSVTGENYLNQEEILAVAQGLYYAGYSTWPNVGVLNIPPQQTVENMVVTVVAALVPDGVNIAGEDIETIMVETVNYPVTNYPPVIEDIDDQIFYVGEKGTYQLNAMDADSFSLSPAGVFVDDITNLSWTAHINGYPSYQYGPYTQPLIDQRTGLFSFTPEFEGVYEAVITVRDPKGAEAYAAFMVYAVNSNTWLNHPPVMLANYDSPAIGQAGKDLTLFIEFEDPDGEELYYSCNIGAVGYVDGAAIWTFNTNYPGTYLLEIVAYDQNGGYAVDNREVVITPWWSI